MSAQVVTWRVSTPEGVFETDLETLKQWIAEGCVLPTDKVSKGSLNWIDAGRVPILRSAFSAETSPTAPAAQSVVTGVADQSPASFPDASSHHEPVQSAQEISCDPAEPFDAAPPAYVCYNHASVASKYVCKNCRNAFCDECPRFLGATKIPACPLCGDMCRPVEKIRQQAAQRELQGSGFGLGDFVRALGYPLQHKVALLFGAGLYGFLLLAGFRGRIAASVIMFGCISHVISQVAWGRMDRNFMPDFSEFSMMDDVAIPIVLGIGITIVSWGPTIVLLLVLVFGVFGGATTPQSPLALTPGQNDSSSADPKDLSPLLDPNADPKKLAEASKKLDQLRPGYQISQEAERSKQQLNDPTAGMRFLLSYFASSLILVGLLLVSLGWAIFYYPMALAVAGYTQSFGSVVNPLVGLDTIRRMGLTYLKAFGMVLMLQMVGFVLAVIVAVITAPLALPFFGNLPAMFIDGALTFYFNLVIACILGLSLYKCADRLGIAVD